MSNIVPRPRKGDRPDRPTRWSLTWRVTRPDGEPQRLYETFAGTKTAAAKRWREKQAEIERLGKRYAPPSRQTAGEYLEHWLATYVDVQLRPSTAALYRMLVRLHIEPYLGKVPLADLTPQQLQAWLAELSSNPRTGNGHLSPRTVSYTLSKLNSALKDAVRLGLLPSNPADRVRPPKQNPKQVPSFTMEQAHVIDQAGRDTRLGVLFSFLWRTGLRIGEAIGLRWSDLDLDAGSLSVHRTVSEMGGRMIEGPPKTKAGRREIALPPQTVDLLRRHGQAQEIERRIKGADWNHQQLVFPSEAGTGLFYRNVRRGWHDLLKRAGLPAHGLHALRHTCASLMLQAGVGLAEIAAHLGDQDTAFVARTYAHVLQATKRQAADRFNRLLEGQDEA